MSASVLGDNYEKAGEVWLKVTSALGLSSLVIRDYSAGISTGKLCYSLSLIVLLAVLTYFRLSAYTLDGEHVVKSVIDIITACTSLVCSGAMIALTILHQRRVSRVFREMLTLRVKYSLRSSRSVLSYFPPSCIFPCLSILLENVVMAISWTVSPIELTNYCFSIYNYVFYGKMQYFLALVEDGFQWLSSRLKSLESERAADAVMELKRLRLMYHELFVCAAEINHVNSSSVILIFGHNFANCVLYTFNGIVELLNPTMFTFGLPYSVILFYWAVCCFYGMYVLVRPCERIRRKAHSIAVAVQSLSTRPGHGKAFFDELRLFSSQLLLENVQFKPHDFLMLNSPMVLSTVGAICSSLAILLQMNTGSD